MARPNHINVIPVIDRLKAKTIFSEDGCWLWTGHLGHNGYGQIAAYGKRMRVHRVSYELHKGRVPEGSMVLHHCDVRNCWNPDHLFIGSAAENTDDMMAKDRHIPRPSPGSANGNAILTDDTVRAIRADTRRIIDIAADYGIHFTTVSDIRRRKSWRHVK
jgi:hypothetical protein